jgi:hypothetical protein
MIKGQLYCKFINNQPKDAKDSTRRTSNLKTSTKIICIKLDKKTSCSSHDNIYKPCKLYHTNLWEEQRKKNKTQKYQEWGRKKSTLVIIGWWRQEPQLASSTTCIPQSLSRSHKASLHRSSRGVLSNLPPLTPHHLSHHLQCNYGAYKHNFILLKQKHLWMCTASFNPHGIA